MIHKSNTDEFTSYLSDASNFIGFADDLFIPENTQELERIITECGKKNTKITIRAGGTSTTGSSSPNGGVIISMEKLNKILDFDLNKRIITVQSGITLKELDDYLSPFGLYLPVDPTEKNATIGGNISTNASGAKSYKYGSILNHIEKINFCYLRNSATLIKESYVLDKKYNKASLKNAAGYMIDDNYSFLFGSEGTLGVIEEVTIKLKLKPEDSLMFLVFFSNYNDLLHALKSLKLLNPITDKYPDEVLDPCLIEYFDSNSLNLLSTGIPNIPSESVCALWIEQESNTIKIDSLLELWFDFLNKIIPMVNQTITFLDEASKNKFISLRHLIPEYINEKISHFGTFKIASDTAVPDENFDEHFWFISNTIQKQEIESYTFGHIGNSHLHCNLIPSNSNDVISANKILKQINNSAIDLHGTISAEHGIGKIKNEYLKQMISKEKYNEMLAIKKKYDPNLLFGSGNIF